MSVSTSIVGVRDLSKKFDSMIKLKLACEETGVPYPKELKDYFGSSYEESVEYLRGICETVKIDEAVKEYKKDMIDGFEVDLSKLPFEVKSIRFENVY